jgi:cell shape-determining protein MreC
MKMSYLLKSSNFEERKNNARKRVLNITLVLIFVVIVLLTSPARKLLFFVAEPLWKVENGILNSNFFQYFKFKQTLIDEKIALEQKLFMAGNVLSLNEILQTENDSLKDLLGRKDVKQKTILATVLVKPPQIPYDMLLVDTGESQGIKVGNKVMASANIYIGEVSEIQENSAKVMLYSTPGRKLPVVLGINNISVEAVGEGGGNFSINLPREVEVKEGDVITIPSITTNVFGIVEKINFKDKDSFQTVLFKSPVNISELNFVEVVL